MNLVAMTIINLGKNIGVARDQTSDLLFPSPQCYGLGFEARQKEKEEILVKYILFFSKNGL